MNEQARGPRPGDRVTVELTGTFEMELGPDEVFVRLDNGQRVTARLDRTVVVERAH